MVQGQKNILIIKDTIIFNAKDSIYIKSADLEQISNTVTEIKLELSNNKEDKFNGVTYDTMFTVIITITIFVIGVLIDRLVKWNNERVERTNLLNYFKNQLTDVKTNILPDLIKAYKRAYQSMFTLDNGLTTSPPKVLTNAYGRLSNMESTMLFKAFDSEDTFNKIFSQIDFLKELTNEVNEYHLVSLNRSSTIRNIIAQLDSNYIKSLINFVEFERTHNPNHLIDPTFNFINKKIIYYHANIAGKRNMTKYYKEVIRPIQSYIVSNNLFRENAMFQEIAENGKLITHKYNELRALYMDIRIQYRQFSIFLKDIKDTLDSLSIK